MIHRIFAVAAAVALAAPPASNRPDAPPDLFANGGFERGLAGWSASLGWGRMGDDARAETLAVRTDGPAAGKKYLRVTNRGRREFIGIEQRVRFQAGVQYTISWRARGKAAKTGHERGGNRLRIWGHGGAEYHGDFPYTSEQWRPRTLTVYSARSGEGGVSLWVWPDGYCDLDELSVRPSFWRADKLAYRPGEAVTLRFDALAAAEGEITVTAPDGRVVARGKRRGGGVGATITFTPAGCGYYRVAAETTLAGRRYDDAFGVCVLAAHTGLDAVGAQWKVLTSPDN